MTVFSWLIFLDSTRTLKWNLTTQKAIMGKELLSAPEAVAEDTAQKETLAAQERMGAQAQVLLESPSTNMEAYLTDFS